MSRKILVTSALPYANGELHIGHLLEYIQTDIWVRYQRLMGHQCQWVWADDAHGTPIMLRAQQEGITPEELITNMKAAHERDIAGFLLSPDNFHSTHSEENRECSEMIYKRLDDAGLIVRKTIKQLFDTEENMFLPDRYVKGICPNCGTADQYGDNCEACSDTGLQDWDISRNAPYFGFEIPNAPGKYFYVWLDAPIGYMASHKNLAARTGEDYEASWKQDSDVELYHFIGKDIINFHCLFWPAMLEGAGFRKPTGIFCHGFLMLEDAKMSKSRGTSVSAENWLKHLDAETLRYYFASKLSSNVVDLNLNLDDFVTRVNADLVGKVVNIASRCAGFIAKQFDGKLSAQYPADLQADYDKFVNARTVIGDYYEQREYGKAMREIMLLAEHANTYINDAEPWVKIKDESARDEVQGICTAGLNYFRIIMTYLSPVLPALAQKTEAFLNTELTMDALATPLTDHKIEKFKPLMTRIESSQIEKLMESTAAQNAAATAAANNATATAGNFDELKPEIEFADFDKIDLRVALIADAKAVEGADKLVELTLDIGFETRTG